MKLTHIAAALLAIAAAASMNAQGQTIERVKMTDNDLTCQQIYTEITQMDGVIALANTPPANATQTAQADANSAGGQVAGAVAQTALAAVAGRTGGFGGFGGFGGGMGNMFGGLVSQMAQGATAQQAANSGAVAQQALAAQQNAAIQGQQAQARKEALTGLFLSKGCKMSDIKK